MVQLPWFKFWASDFICDSKVQKLPLEAQGLLLRMWCICHMEGSIPADPEELSILVRCRLQSVLLSYPLCKPFFEERGGRLFSPRMEREKVKSQIARENAKKKANNGAYGDGSGFSSANGSANSSTKTPAQNPEGQKARIQTPEKPLAPRDETPSVQTIFDLPLPGKQGEYGVPQDFYEECQEAYPGVSVMHELSRMRIWLLANPKRRKTESGMTRFINSWLAKKQNEESGGNTNGNRSHGKADRNLEVLAQSLAQGERQDAAHEAGVFQAGDNRRDDSGTLLLVSGK